MSGETKFGMKPVVNGGASFQCSDKLCNKSIEQNDEYFIDLLKDDSYCIQCGKCLRYARKKAKERGEPIELAEV